MTLDNQCVTTSQLHIFIARLKGAHIGPVTSKLASVNLSYLSMIIDVYQILGDLGCVY